MAFISSSPNCTLAPPSAHSDAGVAGAGILLAFISTAGIALLLSAFITFGEIRGQSKYHNIPRKILSGLSDQQIVEGIGIQIIGLARVNAMVPYHFFIIWMLSLLSTATNFASLMALVEDYKRDWVLRWLRQFAMFVNMVLTIVFGVFVLEANLESLSPTLPISCVWQKEHARSSDGQSNSALSVVGTIAVIVASCLVFVLGTWYLHMRKQRWHKIVRCIALVVLLAMAIGAAARVLMVSQAFGTPSVKLSDRGERLWSFGQLLTMLLLILPFVSALEIFRGEIMVPHGHPGEDQKPLTGAENGDLGPVSDGTWVYQPNPFIKY